MSDIAIYVFFDYLPHRAGANETGEQANVLDVPFPVMAYRRISADSVTLIDGSTVARHALTWAIGSLDDYAQATSIATFAGFASTENDFKLPDYFDERYAVTTGGVGATVRLVPGDKCDEIDF